MTYDMRIQDRLRAQHVKRWHIVQMAREQSLAEHSFNVAQIAREISVRLDHSIQLRLRVVNAALDHDIEEVVRGDAPTPSKGKARYQITGVMTLGDVIKVADLIDAYIFAKEYAVGRHAGEVREYCWAALQWAIGDMVPDERKVVEKIVDEITVGEFTI